MSHDRHGIERSEAFYRALFEVNTAIKLLISPTSGRIVDANSAAVEFYGWPLETLRSMHITDINLLTSEEVQAEMENARSGRRRYFRFRHRTASGAVRHVEVHSGPVEIDSESLLLSIVHDVTERDALEEQLRRSQRLEAVGQLAGGLAHDFNNLLTVMMSCTELVARSLPAGSPLRPHLDDLKHAGRRAADLTRDLLAFSRRQRMQPVAVDLGAVLERMQRLLRSTLGGGVGVEQRLAPDLPCTRVDPSQIEQVVMNLALNARDALSGQGGRIVLQTRSAEIAPGESTEVPAGRWVVLDVIDEGRGMDEATRQRVFEPFFTTKEPGKGTGLGLSTVYGIVTQSGGSVSVRSAPGRGTTFSVYLPLSADTRPAAPEPVAPTPARAPVHACVLLVEDMDEVREVLALGLRGAGFDVVQAASAEQALALPAHVLEALGAVVSDVVMPGRSGVELIEQLLARRPRLRALLISGDLRQHDASGLPAHVRFLQKPFTGQQLAAEVQVLLAGRRD